MSAESVAESGLFCARVGRCDREERDDEGHAALREESHYECSQWVIAYTM